ncbi:MAG: PAC2 family protein, partial [Thermoplasmatales archaeon]|nr:PAC2 family protein [Thermoplasmatales archaeon]
VTGVAGVLLNEGRRANFDVISLLAETRTGMPDARAAAKIIEGIDRLILSIKIDVKPLYKEAERIEKYLRALREKSKPAAEPGLTPQMYG